MELIKYIIEYNGKVTINNEYMAEIKKDKPLVLEWPRGNEIIIDPTPHRVIKINEDAFIVQGKQDERKKEIKKDKTYMVEIEKLGTVLGHVRITKRKGEEIVENYVATKEKREVSTVELPFAFLQCVQYGDYENAREMLAFDISDEQLKEYFGEFEVLINNYLNEEGVVSVLPVGSNIAKTFNFQIENKKIININ